MRNISPREKILFAFLGAVGLLTISIVVFIGIRGMTYATGSPVALTVTIVVGVTALLATLVLASFILNLLGLSDKEEALGLPTGSVRAIIALSLILIFAIMSIFMFQFMAYPVQTEIITTITNSTIANQTITNSTTTVSPGQSQAMIDFSKQTLTILGTLVVAISAFYFGSRSVQVAQGAKEKAELFIDPSETKTWVIGHDEPITIFVKPTPDNADVVHIVDGDPYESVKRESPNRFIYTPKGTDPKVVTLTFKMPAYSDVQERKLTIKILKPDLSIEPPEEKEIGKGKELAIEVKATPENARVEFEISGDKKESVTTESPNKKFKYTPTIDQGKVILTFTLPEHNVSKQLKVNVKK